MEIILRERLEEWIDKIRIKNVIYTSLYYTYVSICLIKISTHYKLQIEHFVVNIASKSWFKCQLYCHHIQHRNHWEKIMSDKRRLRVAPGFRPFCSSLSPAKFRKLRAKEERASERGEIENPLILIDHHRHTSNRRQGRLRNNYRVFERVDNGGSENKTFVDIFGTWNTWVTKHQITTGQIRLWPFDVLYDH